LKYKYAMHDITAMQARLENASLQLVTALAQAAASATPPPASHSAAAGTTGTASTARSSSLADDLLADSCAQIQGNAAGIISEFWTLPDLIVERYADGYLDDEQVQARVTHPCTAHTNRRAPGRRAGARLPGRLAGRDQLHQGPAADPRLSVPG
jgi:hypothetical protein